MRTHTRQHNSSKKIVYLAVASIFVYLAFVTVRTLHSSLILQKRDRLNIVFYSKESELLSLGLSDGVNYIVSFSQNNKVTVPGGYGRYNVGALGKLASIEKNPDLVGKAFSSMASAHVDYYIIPKKPDIYSGEDTSAPSYSSKDFISRIFSSDYTTNANFFDKVYLTYLLSQKRQKDFAVLRSISEKDEQGNVLFSERRFLKKYKGFFYHQALREEEQDVQVIYSEYSAAATLSRVIEGQGIRVTDLSENELTQKDQDCTVVYSGKKTKTLYYLEKTFHCKIQQGTAESSDIKLIMGMKLTHAWK